MNLNSLLIEKGNGSLNTINDFISKYCPDISIKEKVEDVSEIKYTKDYSGFDIVFMDMSKDAYERKRSFDTLSYLKSQSELETIITGLPLDFRNNDYSDLVTDYVLKPFKPERLISAVHHAKSKIKAKKLQNITNQIGPPIPLQNKKLAIPSLEAIELIAIDQILYLESDGRYTIFHLKSGESKIACKNIGAYEEKLFNQNFFRIHHSILANMEYATEIHKKDGAYLKIESNKYLPISKRKLNGLYQFLNYK